MALARGPAAVADRGHQRPAASRSTVDRRRRTCSRWSRTPRSAGAGSTTCPWTAGNYHDFMTLERAPGTGRPAAAASLPAAARRRAGCAWASRGCPASSATRTPRRCRWRTSCPARQRRHRLRPGSGRRARLPVRCWRVPRDGRPCAGRRRADGRATPHEAGTDLRLGTFELAPGDGVRLRPADSTRPRSDRRRAHPRQPPRLAAGRRRRRPAVVRHRRREGSRAPSRCRGRWHPVAMRSATRGGTVGRRRGRRARPGTGAASPRWKSRPDGAACWSTDRHRPARGRLRVRHRARRAHRTRRRRAGHAGRCGSRPARRRRAGRRLRVRRHAPTRCAAAAAHRGRDFDAAFAQIAERLAGHLAAGVHAGQPALQRPPAGARHRSTRTSRVVLHGRAARDLHAQHPGVADRAGLPDRRPAPRADHHVLLGPHRVEPAVRAARTGGLRSWLLRALARPYDRCVRLRHLQPAARSATTTSPTTTRCSGW